MVFLLTAGLILSGVGCGRTESGATATKEPQKTAVVPAGSFAAGWSNTAIELMDGTEFKQEESVMLHPIAKLVLSDGQEILLELYPEKAPQTVANFIYLANQGFYDGLIFHRIIDGFMVQGGDPEGTGRGGPGYCIEGEFALNNHPENDITHAVGVISMARRSYPYNSAGSQFFICVADCSGLDGQYAAFGKVIQGLDSVLALGKVLTGAGDKPIEDQIIKSVTVDTRGESYEPPVKLADG